MALFSPASAIHQDTALYMGFNTDAHVVAAIEDAAAIAQGDPVFVISYGQAMPFQKAPDNFMIAHAPVVDDNNEWFDKVVNHLKGYDPKPAAIIINQTGEYQAAILNSLTGGKGMPDLRMYGDGGNQFITNIKHLMSICPVVYAIIDIVEDEDEDKKTKQKVIPVLPGIKKRLSANFGRKVYFALGTKMLSKTETLKVVTRQDDSTLAMEFVAARPE